MEIYSFLNSFKGLLCEYLKELDAESVKDNLIIIYELMDEIMDNGYP